MDEAALLRLARALKARGYRFVTPTPATHARVNARPANARARTVEDVFGWSRRFGEDTLPAPLPDLMREAGVLAGTAGEWRSTVRLSSLDEMLFVHSAHPTTATDAVFFGPDTYRFAAAILAWLDLGRPVRRAVDIGCGAGPGAVLVARARSSAEVFGTDINPAALSLTRVNARLADVRVEAVHSDLLSGVDGQFDLIVSNPPYLADPSERAYRHGGGPLGAALSLAILGTALARLAPGGSLVLYTGVAMLDGRDPFEAAAAEILSGFAGTWRYREVDPDVFGEELDHGPYVQADRIAAVVLTATRDK